MKLPFKRITFTLFVAFALASCNSSDNAANSGKIDQKVMEVTHELGTTSVPVNPSKVVVLDLGSLETLDQLGVKAIGTAKRNLPAYLSHYQDDASVTDVGTLKEVNFETIQSLSPDLIIISGRLQDSYKELSEIAPTIFVALDYADYIASFEKNTRLLGQVFEKEDQVEVALEEVQTKIRQNQELIKDKSEKGLIVLYNNGKFSAYGKSSRFGFIHDVMGVNAAIEDLEVSSHGNAISSEFIQETNPDYLFVIDRGAIVNGKAVSKDEVENALIKQTNAFKNNKITYLDPSVWYISGGGLASINKMADEITSAVN